ncbi:putative N-glycosidase [Podospora fimiseda]|uniref:N-glycosidase n=1 Tax=Podospora fimiseda TaxID=252190 RepID=A0AAN7BY28_9PEZI|nr:putative N-glycosidase [Podospora fimiseda]
MLVEPKPWLHNPIHTHQHQPNSLTIKNIKMSPQTKPTAAEPLYFWRETVQHGYLSNWYPSPFTSGPIPPSISSTPILNPASHLTSPITFKTSEHHMMYCKALLFHPESRAAILSAKHPRKVKDLGKTLPNFDEKVWVQHREEIVRQGNYLKFSYPIKKEKGSKWFIGDKSLREHLLETGDKELIEASPYDKIWGIGFKEEDAEGNRSKWGLNLLGKVLMEVREVIRAEEKKKKGDGEKTQED